MKNWKIGLLIGFFCSLVLFVLRLEMFDPIVPLADGGAYVVSNGEVWYLRGAEAIKVKKVEKFSIQPTKESKTILKTDLEKSLWALWRNEIDKRRRKEPEYEDQEPPADPR
jgi:hypothetical protein